MTPPMRSFRVKAAFAGSSKIDMTHKVRSSRLKINGQSERPLQAATRVGSTLYRQMKSEATKTCRAPTVFYVLIAETTRDSNGKRFAYQVSIEILKEGQQPTDLPFAGRYRTSTKKFPVDTILGWATCSASRQKELPSKATTKRSNSGTEESSDESEADSEAIKETATKQQQKRKRAPSKSVKGTLKKRDSHSKKANATKTKKHDTINRFMIAFRI
jgi:hypothetical protein